MAQPFQEPRLDMYAQDLLRRSYQDSQIDPQILMQFGQGMPRQTFEPPAPQVQQSLQPSQKRQEYYGLVERRLNELAQAAGGMQELVETGLLDQARRKAEQDVVMLYGEAPAIEKPIRVESVEGINFAIGPTGQPIQLPTETERQAQELAVKKAQVELTQAEKEARDKQFERVNKLEMGLNQFNEGVRIIDQLLSDPRLGKGVGANAFFAALPATEARAIAGMINQIKGQNFLNAYESLRGASGISNIEGQKAEQAMGRIDQYMEEKDLRQALEELRNRYDYARQKAQLGLQYFGASEDKQAQPPATQMAPSPAAPTAPAEPMKVQSPGAPKVVRDPTTNRLIRQQ
jgi:hypothetical protein